MSDITLPPGADPALSRPRPDVAYWVWRCTQDLGRIITWETDAIEGDPSSVIATVFVAVDCYGPTRQRAHEIADQSRRLIKALPWVHWDDGIITSVDTREGPRWVPDENGGPRYSARYAIGVHPPQGGARGRS
ncbi:MAG: hypothetical protein J2P59_02050 [Acidimicrobiales bacterium]|nr:hypothetical protein [Acidimicrobiales bacterium]